MTISHTHPWNTPAAKTSGISAQAIAATASYEGSAISGGGDTHAQITLTFAYGVAPTAGSRVTVELEHSDGTNYDNRDYERVGHANALATTSTYYKTFVNVAIPPTNFKIRVTNGDAAQEVTVTVTISTYRLSTEPV